VTVTEVERVEPTGPHGPLRTERSEINPIFAAEDEVEIELNWDVSGSNTWEQQPPKDSKPSRWDVIVPFVREIIRLGEVLDSQANEEQADGDDEYGGWATFPFCDEYVPLNPDDLDDVDLNTSNFERKMQDLLSRGYPGGGTQLMTSIEAGDRHFNAEFGKRPKSRQPKRAHLVVTDGEADDRHLIEPRLREASDREVWAFSLFGHGAKLKDTVDSYSSIARDNEHVHLYVFDAVSNWREVVEDMKIALLTPQGS
jgi:hypothetical protein